MNVQRFLSNSYRRGIDMKLNKLVLNHNVHTSHRTKRSNAKIIVPKIKSRGFTSNPNSTLKKAKDVYFNKCKDLKVKPNQTAENRFVEQFLHAVKNKSLKLAGLGLGPSCVQDLVQYITVNTNFVLLDLSLNRLGDAGVDVLCEYIAQDGELIDLDLRSNGIGIQGSTHFFNAVTLNTHITSIDYSTIDGIERNRIGTEGCLALANCIRKNQTVASLNLAMCGITADGCKALGYAIPYNSSLVYLDLTANRFGTRGSDYLFAKDNSFGALTHLNLSKNALDDDATTLLCKRIAESKTIKSLNLSSNNLGKRFLSALYDCLTNGQPPIEYLSLADNKFKSDAIVYLHMLIRDFPSIKHYDFSHNALTSKAIDDIAISSEKNGSLTSLDLSDTQIDDVGAKSISRMIENHPSLSKLNLSQNKISDEGGVLIAKSLLRSPALLTLSLADNELRDKTAEVILSILQKNVSIRNIDVSYNDFGCMSYVKLKRVIEEHKRKINANTSELAERHINFLKEEERRLFETREDIENTQVEIDEAEETFQSRKDELKDLDVVKADEVKSFEAQANEIREKYKAVSKEHDEKQRLRDSLRRNLEKRQHDAVEEYNKLTVHRQHLQARHARCEQKKLELATQAQKEMDDLHMRLTEVREQLKMAIMDAKEAKKNLIEKEKLEHAQGAQKTLSKDKTRGGTAKKKRGNKKKKGGKGKNESKNESKTESPMFSDFTSSLISSADISQTISESNSPTKPSRSATSKKISPRST